MTLSNRNSILYPCLMNYVFWNHKKKFQYSVDTYEHWVLFAVEGGSFRYRIGDSEGIAQMGDVIICPPGVDFHREVIHTLSFHFIGFSLSSISRETLAGQEAEQNVHLRLAASSYKPSITNKERFVDNLRIFKSQGEVAAEIDQQSYWQNHVLCDIWLFCLQSIATGMVDEDKEPVDPLMEQARLYIKQNAYRAMSMLVLADELSISPVQLTRRFTRSMGITPSRYLSHIRLEQAKALLVDTHLNLDQIACACGFNNGFYLSRVFTKLMKVSPSAYRNTNRV